VIAVIKNSKYQNIIRKFEGRKLAFRFMTGRAGINAIVIAIASVHCICG